MNKISISGILSICLFSSIASATDFYVGAQIGTVGNTDKAEATGSVERDNSYSDLGIVVGIGNDGGFKGQVKVSTLNYDKPIFDETNKNAIEIGADAIKEFEIMPQVYPFIKAGFGYTIMSLDSPQIVDENIIGVSFNIGGGIAYKVVDNIGIYAGAEYVYRKWQDIVYLNPFGPDETLSISGSGVKFNAGVNFSF